MADANPGQQWTHGWVPLTPTAAKAKNHGKKPPPNSAIARVVAEAAAAAKNLRANAQKKAGPDGTPAPKWTGIGRPSTPAKSPTKAPKAAAPKAAAKPPAKPPRAATQAAPRKLSARTDDALRAMSGRPSKASGRNATDEGDSGFPAGVHGLSQNLKMLRTGDSVEVMVGDDDGKTGTVVGKGGDGEIKVDLGGGKIATLNAGDVSQKRAADVKAPARQAGPKSKAPELAKTEPSKPAPGGGKVSDAQAESKIAGFLEGIPQGKWASMTALRKQLTGIQKDQQDDVLRAMMLAGRVDIEPAAISGGLKPEDHAAAITIGSTPNHQIRASAPAAKPVAKASGKPAVEPPAKTPTNPAAKPAAKAPKAGAKAGTDSHGKALRVGDDVAIRGGAQQGKTGKVSGKGSAGSLKVQVDGGDEIAIDGSNVRNRADHETSRSADAALRKAAGRPAEPAAAAPTAPQGQPSIAAVQGQVRDAYDQLAKKPGDWVSITQLRERMSSGLDRNHVDEALKLMDRMPDVNLAGESNQKTLRPKDRAAAVHFGDQDHHLISIGF